VCCELGRSECPSVSGRILLGEKFKSGEGGGGTKEPRDSDWKNESGATRGDQNPRTFYVLADRKELKQEPQRGRGRRERSYIGGEK